MVWQRLFLKRLSYNMTLLEKSKKLVELRNAISEEEKKLDEVLQPLKQEREALQTEILEELKTTEQFSARFDFATITRAVRKTFVVRSENEAIEWLKEKGLDSEYTAVRLTPAFEALAKESLKNNTPVSGVEIKETEYISVRQPSDKEDKRKVTIE